MKFESGQFIDNSRKLLKVSGLDAKKFLQGIITNDINKSFSSLIYSGLLSPQGKYLFDFFINGLDEENFIIDIDTDSYKDFLNRLNLYKLRSFPCVFKFEKIISPFSIKEPSSFSNCS